MDAAKAAWILYERPDVDLESIAPFEQYGLRAKARLLTIPTTAGSGSEASQAALIMCTRDRRKIEIGSLELIADVTIVDPQFSLHMPPTLTVDVGIDVLSHAIEVYHTIFANDFTDALCMQAARLVFTYLPRAVEHGAADPEAREKMANAATIAGICVANSNIALAHAMGHSAGAVFELTHGRVTAVFLPIAIEFTNQVGVGRYLEMAHVLGLPAQDEHSAGVSLAGAVRGLMGKIGLPLSLQEMGITKEAFDTELEALVERAEMDLGLVTSRRIPERAEIRRLFEYAFDGRQIDF
jgi:alcohol dehydrogenase class IV